MPAFSRRRLIWFAVIALFCAIAAAIGTLIYSLYLSADILNDAYAAEFASTAFIGFLAEHDAHWPRGWSDLDDQISQVKSTVGYELSSDELKRRIQIDFSLTPQQFLDDPHARVIDFTDGRYAHFSGDDPNKKIRSWLESRKESHESHPGVLIP